MIKTLNAYTVEIDDVDFAVNDILNQLDIGNNLCKNSVGILTCYSEFIDTGVVSELSAALPFDIIGSTTVGNAVNGSHGQMMLCLTVLTSDDVYFSAAYTKPLLPDFDKPITEAYAVAKRGRADKPAMIITAAPLVQQIGTDIILEKLDSVSGGVPVFGTVAVDHTATYSEARTVFNNITARDTLAMVLIYGKIEPKFFVTSISPEKIKRQKVIITASKDNLLMEVNNMKVSTYLEDLGIVKNGKIEGANVIPFVLDYNDGTQPVARAFFMMTPEGYAVCGGKMPVNATLSIGAIDYDDVIKTAGETVRTALSKGGKNGLLIFACIARNICLGLLPGAEMECVNEEISGKIPFQFAYVGGEICPVYNEKGETVNRFHNDTFTACIF